MKSTVRYVNNIRIIRKENEYELMAIKAKGIAVINGLINPVLVPKEYNDAPSDGIFELDFMLEDAQNYMPHVELEVDVVFRIKDLPSWVKGVKINASENSDIELI